MAHEEAATAPGTSVGARKSELLSDTLLSTFFIFKLKTIIHDQLLNEIALGGPAGKTQMDHDVWGYARNLEKGGLRLFLMLLTYTTLVCIFTKFKAKLFLLAIYSSSGSGGTLPPPASAPGRRLVLLCGASSCLAGFRWRQGCPHGLAASEQISFRELVTVGLDFFFLIVTNTTLICDC